MLERLAMATPALAETSFGALAPEMVGALLRLPVADRDTLVLVVWGELTYAEAAAALSVPIGTIRSRIARAAPPVARTPWAEAACYEARPVSRCSAAGRRMITSTSPSRWPRTARPIREGVGEEAVTGRSPGAYPISYSVLPPDHPRGTASELDAAPSVLTSPA